MKIKSLAPLRHRDFALFWTGAFVSNVGTWMETLALSFYVTHNTGRATWSGLIAAAAFVPIAFIGPLGGALADRVSRRRVLLTTTFLQTGFAGLITALTVGGRPAPGIVALIVFASGCAAGVGFPAYQAMIPDLVPPDDLVGAIGLGSAQWNLGRVIGPAIAGIVIHFAGISWALAANTLSFLAVVAALLVVRLPPTRPKPAASLLASIREGWDFTRREPGLRATLQTMSVNTFIAAPFIALIPAMAVKVFHGDAGDQSVLVTAQGLGAVTTALALGDLGRRYGVRRVMLGSMNLLPAALVAYAIAPNLWTSAIALYFVGALYLGALSSFTTIAQQRAPSELRGRVMSVNNVALGTLYPAGSALQGALADRAGLRGTTAASGVALAAVMLAARALRPGFTGAVDDPVALQLAAQPAG